MSDEPKFKLGDAVVFDREFPPMEAKYYNPLMFKDGKQRVFIFITEINQAPGHCVLVPLDGGPVEWMRHTADFRLATEDEI